MKKKYLIKIAKGLLLVALLFNLIGCGAQKSTDSAVPQSTVANEMLKSEAMMDTTELSVEEASGTRPENPQVNTEVGYNRKMIKTGELQLQTKEFKKSVEDIVAKVQRLEGYVENSNIQGNNFYNSYNNRRSASLVIRLPQKHFDMFINQSSEFGNVVYTTSNSKDITSEYVDTEIRLKSLKTRHERLLALLEQTGSLKDLFSIEQELGEVTYEIEKLSGALKQYDQMVDMSTVHINIEEVYKIEENRPVVTFGDKIENTFKESVKSLINLFEGLVLIAVALSPFLIIILPVIYIVFVIIKRQQRKKPRLIDESPKEEERE